MEITRESTGELTSTVKIAISQQDYEEKVNKVLKDYQQKANIPGFRPGKVPVGMIRKMYGKAILAEEVNKLLSDSVTQYIQDEKLDILGSPIANTERNQGFDFETQKDFVFFFDLGLAPSFELDLASFPPVERYLIEVDDTMIDKYITDTRKRQGTQTHPETAGPEDFIEGEALELDAEGKPVEGGKTTKVFFPVDQLHNESSKEKVIGQKAESKLVIRPLEFFAGIEEAKKILSVPEEKINTEGIEFEITIKQITHTEPAELNPDFYKKVYPSKEIETEEAFRNQVKEEASASFLPETDKLFFRQVSDKLIHDIQIPLPDEFLKRWLLDHRENKLSADEIEKQYGAFAESMRWQLIENKLLKENGITVEDADIRAYIKDYFLRQIPFDTTDPEADKRLESLVDTVMKNTEQVRKINDEIYNNRLLDFFKTKMKTEEKTIPFDEFVKVASSVESHDHDHDHHDHDHSHDHHHSHDSDTEHHHKH